jgi:hypothetical protein
MLDMKEVNLVNCRFKHRKVTFRPGNGAAKVGHFGADPWPVLFGVGFNGLKEKMERCGAG